jgi:hypothetical protein
MEQVHLLTQVLGAAAVGLYPFVSFPFVVYLLASSFHLSGGMKGSGGGSSTI